MVNTYKNVILLRAFVFIFQAWFSYQNGNMSLAAHLALLTSLKVLLRVGVTTIHYVYWTFKQPWLISSSKVKRLQREGLTPLTAVVLDLDDVNVEQAEVATPENKQLDNKKGEINQSQKPSLNQLEDTTECDTPKSSQEEPGSSGQSEITLSKEDSIISKIKVTKKFELSNSLVSSDQTAEEVARQLELK